MIRYNYKCGSETLEIVSLCRRIYNHFIAILLAPYGATAKYGYDFFGLFHRRSNKMHF